MRTAEKRLSGSRCVRMKYVKTAVRQLPAETLQLLCVVEGQQGVIDASEVITLASVSWVLPWVVQSHNAADFSSSSGTFSLCHAVPVCGSTGWQS